MYLITVARAEENGLAGPVPVALLAGALGVSVASANEMVRKLAGRGLVGYLPYKGVELTDRGRRIAHRVLRTRRLWATFLATHLGFSPGEADDLACSLEHVTPHAAAERLAAFLGDPQAGPLGHRIPPGGAAGPVPAAVPLPAVAVGARGAVAAVDADPGTAAFLAAEGLVAGAHLVVAGSGGSGVLVEVGGRRVHLGVQVAAAVRLEGTDGAP